jgi:hypothetical protein
VQVIEKQSHYPEAHKRSLNQAGIEFEYPSTTLSTSVAPSAGKQQSPESPLQGQDCESSTNSTYIPHPLQFNPQKLIDLTHDEALLFRHFVAHLGRWLDCTDASHSFALVVPEKARQCPLLFYAVLCFAGRHCREDRIAEAAYQRCITMLIDRLNESSASHDETLLLAVLILHLADQLDGELPKCLSARTPRITFSSPVPHGFARHGAFGRYFDYSPCFAGYSFRRSIDAYAP